MKRIIIFSDSHGHLDHMREVLQTEQPDLVIHLGDCLRDVWAMQMEFPEMSWEYVKGNCDLVQETDEKILLVEGVKILICHGHNYHVKSGYLNIEYGAKEKGVDAVLFGHTHLSHHDHHNGLIMLNPGSIGFAVIHPASYGWMIVDGKKIESGVRFLGKDI